MQPSPTSVPSDTDSDPERTAELPVLDPTAYEAAAAHNEERTDSWPVVPSAGVATPPMAGRLPGAPSAVAADRGAGADARLAQVKGELDRLHAEHAFTLSEQSRMRVAADERLVRLGGELDRLHAEHAFTLDEHARVRARFEEELAQARALVSAATARGEELQRQLAEHAEAARTQHGHELERQQLTAREQVRLAGAMHELEMTRARALGYLESLASAEMRRAILEQVVLDFEHEAEGRQVEIGRVARALTKGDTRARAQDAELAQRAARITQLEQQLASVAATLAQRDAQVRELQQETQGLQENVAALQSQVSADGERVRVLQALAQERGSSELEQRGRLAQLQGEREALAGQVQTAHAATAAASAQALAHETALGELRSRGAELESALLTERRRAGQLEDELAGVRAELAAVRAQLAEAGTALRTAQQERSAQLGELSTAAARMKELEQHAADHVEAVRLLQSSASESSARARELEGDLHAAEDVVHRLESEARNRSARVEELEKANDQWRVALEEAQHAATDTAANPALREAAQQLAAAQVRALQAAEAQQAAAAQPPAAAPPDPPEPLPEGATRFLIHTSDGREILHVLGRKTSIGRTPDNDLQIEAQYISRHHAVILAGPVHTIIEDLHSTNGVQVNGRRVTRQALRDGDLVLLGRSQYRFVERKSSAQR